MVHTHTHTHIHTHPYIHTGRWIHVSCALWLNEPRFVDENRRTPVKDVGKIDKNAVNKVCIHSRERTHTCALAHEHTHTDQVRVLPSQGRRHRAVSLQKLQSSLP